MQIFSIVGPTATGKSQLALELATTALRLARERGIIFDGVDIISADSRQVYKGMDVGTGADLPVDFLAVEGAKHGLPYDFWQKNQVRLHGLAIILPTTDWSVSHFQKLVQSVISQPAASKRLVFLVGGTGLYHLQALIQDPQLQIPPNPQVRQKAAVLSLSELQAWLAELSLEKWQSLNQSDRANPRRLVRAIEVSMAVSQDSVLNQLKNSHQTTTKHRAQTLGLTGPVEFLQSQIASRVIERFTKGMIPEVEKLIANYSDEEWKLPAFSAMGFKEVRAFLEGVGTAEEVLARWTLREVQYAKRQLTWWKKQTEIEWFDVSSADWHETAIAWFTKQILL
jgi:tRNA dimethylallyltransferase